MITIRSLFIAFFILLVGSSFAQTTYITKKTAQGKAKRLYDRAVEYASQGMYEKALNDLETVLKQEPVFIDAHLMKAGMLFNLDKFAEAEASFEAGLQLKPDYSAKAYYTLAVTEQKLQKYGEAAAHFKQYIDHPKAREILVEKAKRNYDICNFSMTATKEPVPFTPVSLGTNINTNEAEYLPSFTADGETLVYTKRVRGQEDFYLSTKENGEWLAGLPLENINTLQNEGAQSISADGKFLVFTACQREDGYGSCDLYYSEVRDGRWTPPANLGAPVNSRAWESQPSLSADGNTLYFVSERNGGMGGVDIWLSRRQSNGKWSQPENLGAPVNTPSDDQAPFIHQDGQTLYFMSKGHPGLGGHDLFLSRKNKEGAWETPQNLGYPINTMGNEGALVISLDGKTAYFASDRKYAPSEDNSLFDQPSTGGETDLYSFELYEDIKPQSVTYVKAKVKDAETGQPLSAQAEFVDLATGSLHASKVTASDGEFLVVLPMGKDYALNVSKKKYLFHSENFSLSQFSTLEEPYLLTIELQAIPDIAENKTDESNAVELLAQPIILKNVFFDTGSATLRPNSYMELDKLRDLLRDNPALQIQINGHTDDVGGDSDNLTLSHNRAKAVYDYLINQEIDPTRLAYKGFGEEQPIDSNDTEKGRQNNRRTEFVILR